MYLLLRDPSAEIKWRKLDGALYLPPLDKAKIQSLLMRSPKKNWEENRGVIDVCEDGLVAVRSPGLYFRADVFLWRHTSLP